MSQTQVEALSQPENKLDIMPVDDEDLEDGEIDDSDEDGKEDADVIIVAKDEKHKTTNDSGIKAINDIETVVTVTDSSNSDTAPTPPPTNANLIKSKKPTPVEDDHASSIENAIAMALKKKGVEPAAPKILESKSYHNDDKDEIPGHGQGLSKSSRRRKRKKQREEKEKEKERKEKKKRYDTADPLGPPPFDDDENMDEYEMLNVRGGSPPPLSALPSQSNLHMYKDHYDSEDDSAGSSYDSYDSDGDDSNNERRRRKRKKESRKRKERRQRDEDKRNEKRSRRDSTDYRHEPRKLELCKFYLMECCAKKDKCSYMHSDFPCKYYYLGMECAQKEDCKFAHDEPLSEELRNILLKHLETAPKEILGNFKRLSRENALAMVTKRHEELWRTYNVQNVWAPCSASSLPIHSNRRNTKLNDPKSQQQPQQQQQQQQQTTTSSSIPSLLDLVLNPPSHMENNKTTNSEQNKRKSRWTDSLNSPNQINIEPPSKTTPAYLDLKNLHGILSAEHIAKLQDLGIVNLEQVNQLTFGQLNQIGLTIAEITEIQLNAVNMAKLGVTTAGGNTTNTTINSGQNLMKTNKAADSFVPANKETSSSSNGDVDMRVLPSASSTTVTATSSTSSAVTGGPDKDVLTSSNSNSSNGVVTVDYSQYLKDSNISFDRGDMYDDEKDEQQLVIDDYNSENEEQQQQQQQKVQDTNVASQKEEETFADSLDNSFASKLATMSSLAQTFRNPFKNDSNLYDTDKLEIHETTSRCTDTTLNKEKENESGFYRRYSRESRSRSRTPTRSQSNTPEASLSPQPLQIVSLTPEETNFKEVTYDRGTMYDFCSRYAEEDELRALKTKMDKDMRFLPGGLGSDATATDIDLRLPFQPMTSYTPATEIDGSITLHFPITYKVYEIDVPRASYAELRQHFKSDHATDPRLRRILGLPELSQSKTSAAIGRKVRKTSRSSSIASPSESDESSPKYYTPPTNLIAEETSKSRLNHRGDPRADPRSENRSDPRSDPRRQDPRSAAASSNTSSNTSGPLSSANAAGGQKQNVEIRNLLQKSEWYKNLNSKFKIMVNQQLALVSTELKKFHQDSSPNKIFDISFIVNNQTLQQILTNLGIFIDDNGEVAHVDNDELADSSQDPKSNINLPNLSQPPPNVGGGSRQQNNPALDFLRAPPPNLVTPGPPPIALGPMFQRQPMHVQAFARPSILGLPPGAQGNPINPFGNPMNININPNFLAGGANLLGPFGPNFGPGLGIPTNLQQQQQRNFNNNQRNQRNQNRRII